MGYAALILLSSFSIVRLVAVEEPSAVRFVIDAPLSFDWVLNGARNVMLGKYTENAKAYCATGEAARAAASNGSNSCLDEDDNIRSLNVRIGEAVLERCTQLPTLFQSTFPAGELCNYNLLDIHDYAHAIIGYPWPIPGQFQPSTRIRDICSKTCSILRFYSMKCPEPESPLADPPPRSPPVVDCSALPDICSSCASYAYCLTAPDDNCAYAPTGCGVCDTYAHCVPAAPLPPPATVRRRLGGDEEEGACHLCFLGLTPPPPPPSTR